ncbi:hypothetical protein PUNSTDRAFT_117294 [Punctularia strigosozonata HHB-11173 SS5]|uniref:uncharacterized protein n=1 Tax=Punctularia strigosozonata (strain HHB-11173) TaxID=741275 RepID=UPI00044168FF|nr:uncharacterized protein PUNSTDRAFT_117294 [Punctularia strigosozonata HHB-11173 SS5]EIN13555.1 hypothetical protein PUNSTDRAFT_117294 [Punctularia strigosozonata HHB-11173 SS5]
MNLERDAASWNKVTAKISYVLTQLRSKIKKAIQASLNEVEDEDDRETKPGPAETHTPIYDLAQQIVAKYDIRVTAGFCARLAVMRQVYLEGMEGDFWEAVDERLETIRSAADGSKEKQEKALKQILKKDRELHGARTTEQINEMPCTFQDEVDEALRKET